MKKSTRSNMTMEWKEKPAITVGLDLGDRFSHYCRLQQDEGDGGRPPSNQRSGLRKQFEGEARQRIAMECGTHSPSVSRLLEKLGHHVMVANARNLRAISQNESKNDRADAERLAG